MALNRDQVAKLSSALTAGSDELSQLLQEQDMGVLSNLLRNPQLTDHHLLALLKRRDLNEGLLKSVSKHELVKSSHQLKVALATNQHTPAPVSLALLPQLYLFELLNLCILPGSTPDQRLAAERQIIQRLPTTELGQKLTLARRGTTKILEELVKTGEPQILTAALDNPHLKESAISAFLRSGKATAPTISQIARHSRWNYKRNLRLSILKHRQTPAIWFTLWLPDLKNHELEQLSSSRQLGLI